MKTALAMIVLALTALTAVRAELYYSLNPKQAVKDEPVVLSLTNTDGESPELTEFPEVDGLRWLNRHPQTSSSVSIVNGKRSSRQTSVYSFVISKTGKVEIPALRVRVDGKTATLPKMEIEVSERSFGVSDGDGRMSQAGLDELVYMKVELPDAGRTFYVGEEIPLKVKIYASTSVNFQLSSWPELRLEKAVIRDYSGSNQENRNFAPPRRGGETVKGRDFSVYEFSTAFRPIAAGDLSGSVEAVSAIRVRDTSRRNDMFGGLDDWGFFGGGHRNISKKLHADIPAIKVRPLPEAPAGTEFIGLVGNWHMGFNMKDASLRAGEASSLKVEITGLGTLETLRMPPLNLPGFRVYPPEVERDYDAMTGRSRARVNYIMIPTEPGTSDIELSMAVFDCVRSEYRTFKFERKVLVDKADKLSSSSGVFVAGDSTPAAYEPKKTAPAQSRSSIIYLKRNEAGKVEIPLYLNYIFYYALLLIAGPATALLCMLLYRRRRKLENSPELVRRNAALSGKRKMLSRLRKSGDAELDELVRAEVVPFINAMMALPPGTTASELSTKVKDAELAECLRHSGESAYMPGVTTMDKGLMKRQLYKALKRMSVLALMLCCASGIRAEDKGIEALNAYDNGDFATAAAYYRGRLNPHAQDPALLYNLGNCLSLSGKYAAALACYEQARRLRPNDSDIEENLNFVRRKLMLPEVGSVADPLELLLNLRDRLRPDVWLLLACSCWCAIFLLAGCGSRRPGRSRLLAAGLCAALMLLSLAASISQHFSTYGGDEAVVLGRHVKIYSLPSDKAQSGDKRLACGNIVRIIERRGDWVMIRCEDKSEGWVKSTEIVPLWNGLDAKTLDTITGMVDKNGITLPEKAEKSS